MPPVSPRIGLISNPHSGRNRRMLGHVQNILAAAGGVHHEVTSAAEDIPEALARMAGAGVEVVAVNGGDGSVALVLGALMSATSPFSSPPLLCALPGGTTNVTVGDVGIRGDLDVALLRLLAWRNGRTCGTELRRQVIGVRNAQGELLGCGLVFGAGAVVTGIEYWQESVRSRGMRSEYSSGVAMTRTVWGMLRGHERFAKPVRMRVEAAGAEAVEADFMLLAISTLERLFLGIHPFWGQGEGSLKLIAIERGAAGFLTALPAILRGKQPAQTALGGYHSTRTASIRISFHGSYTMDGELHATQPADSPLCVFPAGEARFLRIAT
jgi:diacylglycerol kinase (ATP)